MGHKFPQPRPKDSDPKVYSPPPPPPPPPKFHGNQTSGNARIAIDIVEKVCGEGDAISFGGMEIKPSEITSVTFSRDGKTYTISKDDEKSQKVKGFGG